DLFLKLPAKDWNAYYQGAVAEEEAEDASRAKRLRNERLPNARPPRPLEAYAGAYQNDAYGTCRIALDRGTLIWHWNTSAPPLEHWKDDTFLVSNDVLRDAPFHFRAAPDGALYELEALECVFRRKK